MAGYVTSERSSSASLLLSTPLPQNRNVSLPPSSLPGPGLPVRALVEQAKATASSPTPSSRAPMTRDVPCFAVEILEDTGAASIDSVLGDSTGEKMTRMKILGIDTLGDNFIAIKGKPSATRPKMNWFERFSYICIPVTVATKDGPQTQYVLVNKESLKKRFCNPEDLKKILKLLPTPEREIIVRELANKLGIQLNVINDGSLETLENDVISSLNTKFYNWINTTGNNLTLKQKFYRAYHQLRLLDASLSAKDTSRLPVMFDELIPPEVNKAEEDCARAHQEFLQANESGDESSQMRCYLALQKAMKALDSALKTKGADSWALGAVIWKMFYPTCALPREGCDKSSTILKLPRPNSMQEKHLQDLLRVLLDSYPKDRISPQQALKDYAIIMNEGVATNLASTRKLNRVRVVQAPYALWRAEIDRDRERCLAANAH